MKAVNYYVAKLATVDVCRSPGYDSDIGVGDF